MRKLVKRAAEPTAGHVELARALGLFMDDLGRLTLRSDEQDVPAASDRVGDERVRPLEELRRLVEVDDVDPVAGAVDVGAHPWVPALGLMTKVDAGVDEGP